MDKVKKENRNINFCVGRKKIGCAVAFVRWVWATEISRLFYIEISALPTYKNGGVANTQITSE